MPVLRRLATIPNAAAMALSPSSPPLLSVLVPASASAATSVLEFKPTACA